MNTFMDLFFFFLFCLLGKEFKLSICLTISRSQIALQLLFFCCLFLLESHFVRWNYHTDLGSLVTHRRLEKNIQKMGKSQMSSSYEMLLRHSSLILV